MSRYFTLIRVLVLVALGAGCLAGCGGAGGGGASSAAIASANSGEGGKSGDPVAQVGGATITKTSLNHWMSTIMGGDFYEISHRVAPSGLVSEPANYAACIAGLEKLVASLKEAKPAAAELKSKCEQLYQALRQQTLSYLITADVAVGQAAEQGLTVSSGEIEQDFRHIQAEQFPNEAELQRYLSERHWSVSDELFLVKRDLLSSKLRSKLEQKFPSTGHQEALVKYVHEANKRWTEKTACRPGFVVEGCSEYTSVQANATAASPSAAILIEELTHT